jgi:phosphohistidine phosphatase SixA
MRQLLLLRHAQAEPASPGGADSARALTRKGRSEAVDAARCIMDAELRCEALLASPAVRTRETAAIVAAKLGLDQPPHFEPGFYLGDADALLAPLAALNDRITTLLLVAHNPGISQLAGRFQLQPPPLELRTAGLCLISFGGRTAWSDLRPKRVTAVRVLR